MSKAYEHNRRNYQTRTPRHASHAFVGQRCSDVQVEARQITGQVEHLASRHATTFASLQALLAFMAQILQERDLPR
jgi:hypothetical protein